jgi:uncharacterized membrane protein YphA (DoxX/SURF4 family)
MRGLSDFGFHCKQCFDSGVLRFQKNPGHMKPIDSAMMGALIARVVLGCWFVYSGGVKVFGSGLDRFTRDIANYKLVGPPLDAITAYAVPWFEIAAGLCLMLGMLRRGAILATAGLVCVFAFCIGWAWFHQLDISCGCHGGDAKIQYWGKVAEFAGYFLLLGWLWWMEVRRAPQKLQNMA